MSMRLPSRGLYERVDDLLLALWTIVRHRIERGVAIRGPDRAWRTNHEYMGAIDALVGAGLIDRAGASKWRARLKGGAAGGEPWRGPRAIAPDVRAALGAALPRELSSAWVVVDPAAPSPPAPDPDRQRQRAMVMEAAAELGLVSWSEAMRYGSLGPHEVGSASPAFVTDGPEPAGFRGALRGVIAHADLPAGLWGVELYDDAVLVRGGSRQDGPSWMDVHLFDDRGTSYRYRSGSAGPDWFGWWVPGVPEKASRLMVATHAESKEVRLRQPSHDSGFAVDAAIRHLEESYAVLWLWHLRERPDRYFDPAQEWSERQVTKIALLEQAGVLPAEEAASWRARFERLQRWRWPRGEVRRLRDGARAFIEQLASELDRNRGEARVEGRFRGALLAFDGSELFSPAETLRWCNRARLATPSSDDRLPKGMRAFDELELIRVIAGPEERAAGLRVTAIRLYNGGLVLHWNYEPAAARPADRGSMLHLTTHFPHSLHPRVSDDLGTRYYAHTSTVSNYGYELDERAIGRSTFIPAVPARARRLKLHVGRDTVAIRLR